MSNNEAASRILGRFKVANDKGRDVELGVNNKSSSLKQLEGARGHTQERLALAANLGLEKAGKGPMLMQSTFKISSGSR